MADYLPKFHPGEPFTAVASAPVIGGRLLRVSGAGSVAHVAADATMDGIVGVAGFDAAPGEEVTVYPLRGAVHKLTASGAIAAAATVATAAEGKVYSAYGTRFAVALTSAVADGDVVEVIC